MVKTKDFILRSMLICDVARKELGGKDILIGVYSGSMLSKDVPFSMPSFAVWLEVRPLKKSYKSVALEIITPKEETLIAANGQVVLLDNSEFSGIPFQFGSFMFPMEGIYKVKFGFDGKLEEVGNFKISKGEHPV